MKDLLLGGLNAGIADQIAFPVDGMTVFIGSVVVFQIIRGDLAGVADNIADIFGVMVPADKFLLDLDAVLF